MGFGGNDDENNFVGEICAIDMENNKCKKCSIKWPGDVPMEAVIVRDACKDKLLAFGYVNMCFKEKELENAQLLPHYLIQLIGNCFVMEYIHLFDYHAYKDVDEGIYFDHYHMNVDYQINLTLVT